MFEAFGRVSSAGADGVSSMNPEASPPCAFVAPARLVNRRSTSDPDVRVHDASGVAA